LRAAVASGELNGKLPGERVLARRFGVNAKTLSKALTDLAAEGLLERSIGRGTYVKGTAPEVEKAGKWLILCDDDHTAAVQKIEERHPEVHVARDVRGMRPSFLNQFQRGD
jgi:DNA-binding GntR family transcriptional regulator